jgi:hypothetical protein
MSGSTSRGADVPISPARSTGLKGSDAVTPEIDSGSAGAADTLAAVASGDAVTVVTYAFKAGITTGNLINAVTIGGTGATLAVRSIRAGTNSRTEVCIWYTLNVSAGDKAIVLDFVHEDDSTYCNWHADSWAVATASALDITSTSDYGENTSSVSVPSAGSTAALAQATELVLIATCDKFNYDYNGDGDEPGTAPTGYIWLSGQVSDNLNKIGCQSAYKETSSTAGVNATWSQAAQAGAVAVAALATFKITTVQKRVKVLADSDINGATGITAFAWSGDPSAVLATKWTGISAESSGGIVYLSDPPSAWVAGSDVNVVMYQPAGDKAGTSFVVGRVEEY